MRVKPPRAFHENPQLSAVLPPRPAASLPRSPGPSRGGGRGPPRPHTPCTLPLHPRCAARREPRGRPRVTGGRDAAVPDVHCEPPWPSVARRHLLNLPSPPVRRRRLIRLTRQAVRGDVVVRHPSCTNSLSYASRHTSCPRELLVVRQDHPDRGKGRAGGGHAATVRDTVSPVRSPRVSGTLAGRRTDVPGLQRPRWAVYMASRPPTASVVVVRVDAAGREGRGAGRGPGVPSARPELGPRRTAAVTPARA